VSVIGPLRLRGSWRQGAMDRRIGDLARSASSGSGGSGRRRHRFRGLL